jgi:predicted house-cleaning noncanonical NTP pyrophosphatase (MazG superfamily)
MIRYDKLVRDRIPEIIRRDGKQCEVRVLDDAEYRQRLEEKLSEELTEYRGNGELEELADLVELVHALVVFNGMTWHEFETMRTNKRMARGGFNERFFLGGVSQ